MIGRQENPPRNGEGDRAQRGGGGHPPLQRPIVYRARQLRKDMSLPERILWQHLRQRPGGFKFRKQHAVGDRYVVDFCCLSARLIVEVDGISHEMGDRPARDIVRSKFLEYNGFRVLRITARQVMDDVTETVGAIVACAESPLHRPADGPPPRAGEDF